MKTAVVYYSYTGTTKKYAEKIRDKMDAELIEIKPIKDIKAKGVASYVTGGIRSLKKKAPELMEYSFDSSDYDLIILASPVWAFTYSPAMRSFLEKEKLTGCKVACLLTHLGDPKEAVNKFNNAVSGNELAGSLDLCGKDDEGYNMNRLNRWIGNLQK